MSTAASPPASFDFNAWEFWSRADEEEQRQQLVRQTDLINRTGATIGDRVFVSSLAMVEPSELTLGDRSYIAAHAYVTHELRTGSDCTINAFTVVRGKVTLGDGVRIGAHTSILGFNHSMAPDRPVFRQPTSSRGITIGDDVWVGSNVVIVDGITIGSHAVIGAGSVVTKDVAEWAIVGGNPARLIRDRRTPGKSARRTSTAQQELGSRLADFADRARDQADKLIERCWEADAVAPDGTPTGRYLDKPGAAGTLRAHADAVEISALLHGRAPEQLSHDDHVRRLRQNQDARTGLTPILDENGLHGAPPSGLDQGETLYHVLSLGYALDVLGSRLEHPIHVVQQGSPTELAGWLHDQPWRERGWGAGAFVDMIGTAMLWNFRHGDGRSPENLALFDTYIGWLVTHARRDTGLWSGPRLSDGMLQPVNGYYRASRGSFAQFGLPVAYPELVIDAVLAHAEDDQHFGPGRTTACNVLDVAHPLWLVRQQTGHRAEEIVRWAQAQIPGIIEQWQDGEGFAFAHPPLVSPGRTVPRSAPHTPGLQGTEMWLATLWLIADLCGVSESLGYRPAGVHRPEPAMDVQAG